MTFKFSRSSVTTLVLFVDELDHAVIGQFSGVSQSRYLSMR